MKTLKIFKSSVTISTMLPLLIISILMAHNLGEGILSVISFISLVLVGVILFASQMILLDSSKKSFEECLGNTAYPFILIYVVSSLIVVGLYYYEVTNQLVHNPEIYFALFGLKLLSAFFMFTCFLRENA